MIISCPNCDFTKDVDPAKIPAGANRATCPKCRVRFDLPPDVGRKPDLPARPPDGSSTDDTLTDLDRPGYTLDHPLPEAPPEPDPTPAWEDEPQTDFYRSPDRRESDQPESPDQTRPEVASLKAGAREEHGSFDPRDGLTDFGARVGGEEAESQDRLPLEPGPETWESGRGGFLSGFWATARAVIFRPGRFFSRPVLGDPQKAPFVFGLVSGSLGFVFLVFWMMVGGILLFRWTGEEGPSYMTWGLIFLAGMPAAPLATAVGLYAGSALTHVFLLMAAAGGGGFGRTLRTLSYASAAQLLHIVPFLGSVLAGVWAVVLLVRGLAAAHRVSTGRILTALFIIPFLLSILFLTLAFVILHFI